MNAEERQALREKHRKVQNRTQSGIKHPFSKKHKGKCADCNKPYPCDVIKVLDVLDIVSDELDQATAALKGTVDIASRLSGALLNATPEPVSEIDPKLSEIRASDVSDVMPVNECEHAFAISHDTFRGEVVGFFCWKCGMTKDPLDTKPECDHTYKWWGYTYRYGEPITACRDFTYCPKCGEKL